MRVFFTSSNRTQAQYQPYTDEILTLLQKSKVSLMTTEDERLYRTALEELETKGFKSERAHYEFITRSIAEADIMIVEASHQSFRLGHEVTLALLYGKPTLVVSQERDYSTFISHNLLQSAQYTTKKELQKIVRDFLKKAETHFSKLSESTQIIGMAVDNLQMIALSDPRAHALRDPGTLGDLARLAEEDSDKAYKKVHKMLGHLPAGEALSVLAPIYQEDTPDYIFGGVASFVKRVLADHSIEFDMPVITAMARAGALPRQLAEFGYKHIISFDSSRPLLAEAFRLSAHYPSIYMSENAVESFHAPQLVRAATWLDFTTNLTLTSEQLQKELENLLNNLTSSGCLIFDVRTSSGWHSRLYGERVLAFATDETQRIQINEHHPTKPLLTIDFFMRMKHKGVWGEWRREQATERMWSVDEIVSIIEKLKNTRLEAIYDDNFQKMAPGEKPGLAYFVLVKD